MKRLNRSLFTQEEIDEMRRKERRDWLSQLLVIAAVIAALVAYEWFYTRALNAVTESTREEMLNGPDGR
jgi:hypothetical protein